MTSKSSVPFNFTDELSPFDLIVCSYGCDPRHAPGHIWGPLVRNSYSIQCCIAGRGIFVSDGHSFPVEKEQCFVTFPGRIISEHADKADPWGMLWLSVKGAKAKAYFDTLDITEENPVFPWCFNQHITDCIYKIINAGKVHTASNELQQMMSTCSLFKEFFRLNAEGAEENLLPSKSQEDYVASAIRYMEMHYDQNIKISFIADYVGLNRSYFFTIFKKYTNVSPQDYLINLRIRKACEFLCLPQTTISNVAYSVGYDPLVFSKIFKRIMGCSPTEYKKKNVRREK